MGNRSQGANSFLIALVCVALVSILLATVPKIYTVLQSIFTYYLSSIAFWINCHEIRMVKLNPDHIHAIPEGHQPHGQAEGLDGAEGNGIVGAKVSDTGRGLVLVCRPQSDLL